MAEPDNLEIPAMLIQLLMRLGRYGEVQKIVLTLPAEARDSAQLATLRAYLEFILLAREVEDPQAVLDLAARRPADLDTVFKAAALHLVKDDCEAALQALIVILHQARDYNDGAARCGLLAVFDTLGGDLSAGQAIPRRTGAVDALG